MCQSGTLCKHALTKNTDTKIALKRKYLASISAVLLILIDLLCDGNLKTCRKDSTNPSYSGSFCSQNGVLCQEWEGDCDNDNECDGSLECGTNNCPAQNNFPADADCCYQP